MTFKKLTTDDPKWHREESFIRMTPSQRYRFRKTRVYAPPKIIDESPAKDLPFLPQEIWLHAAEFLLADISAKGCETVIQAFISLMSCSRDFYSIFSDENLWKKISRRLASLVDIPTETACPISGDDSWRKLALRLMPSKSHSRTCKSLYKTTVLKEHHLSEKSLLGKISFEKRTNPYDSSRQATLFKACSVRKIKLLLASEIKDKENKLLVIRERAAELKAARERLVKAHGLDRAKFIGDRIRSRDGSGHFRIDSPLQTYLKSGKGWSEVVGAGYRFFALERQLKKYNIAVRDDSVLCRDFVLNGSRGLTKVVKTMVEMNFLFASTDYKALLQERMDVILEGEEFLSRDEYHYFSIRASKEIKRDIYRSLGDEKIREGAPEVVEQKIKKYMRHSSDR